MRAARVVNPMTKDEASRADVAPARSYFRVEAGKQSMSPAAEKADWYRLENFRLANGDNVGVAVRWSWPDVLEGVTVADLRAVQAAVAKGRWRENPQAKDWVGHAIAGVLGLDCRDKGHRAKISGLLKVWIANKMFVVVPGKDPHGEERSFVEVGERADD
jgi:hypothetical protein